MRATATSFEAVVDGTNWSRLTDAYEVATDAPEHLRTLAFSSDIEAQRRALDELENVLHQGTAFTAAGPVARALAALLIEAREPPPLRGAGLDFLACIGEATEFQVSDAELEETAHPVGREAEIAWRLGHWGEESDEVDEAHEAVLDTILARAVLACRAALLEKLEAASRYLDDADGAVRIRAANCVARLLHDPQLAERRLELAGRIALLARDASTPERGLLVLSLGEAGGDTTRFLEDPEQAVRVCAALAPAQADSARAAREILEPLLAPAAADRWLPRNVPQVGGWLRFTLVREAIDRTASLDEVLPAALAVVREVAEPMTVDHDWGALLAAAFPSPPEGALAPAQHAYLAALVDNDALWNPRNGNASAVFRKLGLPYDRAACRELLEVAR